MIGDISTSGLKCACWEFMFVPSSFDLLSDGEVPGDTAATEKVGEDKGEKASLFAEWIGIWGNFDISECSSVFIAASEGASIGCLSNFWCKLGHLSSVESPPAFGLKQKIRMKLFSL